jgi:hypothetical protein
MAVIEQLTHVPVSSVGLEMAGVDNAQNNLEQHLQIKNVVVMAFSELLSQVSAIPGMHHSMLAGSGQIKGATSVLSQVD